MAFENAKGELGFEVEGRRLTLAYSIDALCKIEEIYDRNALTVFSGLLRDPQLRKLRVVLWAGLQAHHKDIDQKAAGELILSLGGVTDAVELINNAFLAAFPPAEVAEGAAGPQETPPAAAAGNGDGSTVSG